MIPQFSDNQEQEFLDENKSILLNKKINKKIELLSLDGIEYSFILQNIDLWIFEEHISFFVFNIDLDYIKYSLNQLANFHKILRSFKNLRIEKSENKIIFKQSEITEGEKYDILSYLLELTGKEDTFLNINENDCKNLVEKTTQKENFLFPIYNTSINAKLLVGMQLKEDKFSDSSLIEEYTQDSISFNDVRLSILEELPYYVASCMETFPTMHFIPSESYLYGKVEEGGFSPWKYSSGVTIYDSCAIVGLKSHGGPVVSNINSNFYFIYMLNLYISFQIRYIENKIINKNFESIDINYQYKKLQTLKNHFLADEIAVKFQENEFHSSVCSALRAKNIIEEVTSNLMETKAITQSNKGVILTLGSFLFVSIFQDPLMEQFKQYSFQITAIAMPTVYLVYKYRVKLRKLFKL